MQQRFFRFLMQHGIPVILGLVAITAVLGYFAAGIEFDNSIESYFLEDDLRDYSAFLDEFGSDEIVVVAFGADNIFTPENFALIDRLSREIEKLPHVRRVISLTTAKIVWGRPDSVVFDRLTPTLPSRPEPLAAIRSRALADPIIPGTLISSDGRHTAIVAEIDHIIGEFDYKVELLNSLRAIVARQEAATGQNFKIGGTAVLDDALFRYTQRDQTLFFPVMIFLMVAVMYAMFRRIVTTFLPLMVVVISVIWTYGFMSLMGFKINVISTIIGPLLMAVGIADSMHIIADYLQESSAGKATVRENIERSFHSVLGPCVMTSITTILGLLSLLSADLVPIRQFGIVGAVGVFVALLVTILLLPILLAIIPVARVVHRIPSATAPLSRLLTWLGVWQRTRSRIVLLACTLALAPAVYALGQLTVGTNSLDYFRKKDPVRTGTEWIDRNIGGTTSLEFLIEADQEDALAQPALLEKMERFQAYLRTVPGITKVFSVTDLLKSLNQAFEGGPPEAFRIPQSAAAVAQELLVIDGSADLNALLSPSRTSGRISARVAMNSSRKLAHDLPRVEAQMREIFGESARVVPTGMVYLMHQMEAYLLSSQIRSFLLAFLVITVAMVGALRSLELGVLAMIPNLLPIVFVLALMPLLDIPLDVGTVMTAGVALGLVVDDTIHFLYRLKEQQRRGADTHEAIVRAMQLAGRPIVFTSIVLSLGFSILIFASFNPIVHFGILASVVILLALVFDLLVLPAILGLVHPRSTGLES